MSSDLEMYNILRNIQMKSVDLDNFAISKDEYMKKYIGTQKEATMKALFSFLDKTDDRIDDKIDLSAEYNDGMQRFRTRNSVKFFKPILDDNGIPNDYEFDEEYLKKLLGNEITKEDYQEALKNIEQIVTTKVDEEIKIKHENSTKLLKQNLNDNIPEKIVAAITSTLDDYNNIKIKKVIGSDNKLYFNVNNDENNIYCYNNNGDLVSFTNTNKDFDEYGEVESFKRYFIDDNKIKTIKKYKNGLAAITYKDGTSENIFGKTSFQYDSNGEFKNIVINKGLPNETIFYINTNDKLIVNIEQDTNNVIKTSEKTLNDLKKIYNQGLVFGVDYTLEAKCNELCIEYLKEDNFPKTLNDEIVRLNKKGLSRTNGYSVEKLDDDNYSLKYNTLYSRNYKCDSKEIIYDNNGNIVKITEEIDGKIYITENNQTRIEEKLTENNNDLMPYEKFDVQQSSFAKNLYFQGEIKHISDDIYTQKVGQDNYKVIIEKDKICIKKNNKKLYIDTKGWDENVTKFISNTNPRALYDIARSGTKILLQPSSHKDVDAEFLPDENAIYINPDVSPISILHRRIVHEIGHSFYNHTMPINKNLEESFEQETKAYADEIKALDATAPKGENDFQTQINIGETRRKYNRYIDKDSNQNYCATNIYEFVAEAYCLLTTGHAKSEVSIAYKYPKTFELVKKLIESMSN